RANSRGGGPGRTPGALPNQFWKKTKRGAHFRHLILDPSVKEKTECTRHSVSGAGLGTRLGAYTQFSFPPLQPPRRSTEAEGMANKPAPSKSCLHSRSREKLRWHLTK